MATYTSILKLIKQAFKDAAWHTNLNTTLDLVDEALSYKSIAITGNTTLTLTDGVSSDVRRMFLEFTGTLSANATITIPALPKNFRVKNSTTGGYSLVFTTGSGNTVTVANGDVAPLWCDGTNVALSVGTAGLRATGTSGGTVPLLNTANTFSAKQTFTKSVETIKGAAVAAAGSTDIWTPADGNVLHISVGTGAITDFGTASQAGAFRIIELDATIAFTHGSNLVCPGGKSFSGAAGDRFIVYADTTTKAILLAYTDVSRAGRVVRLGRTEYTARTATASAPAIPRDNTIPQITEGTEYMTITVTNKFANSKLLVRGRVNLGLSSNLYCAAALFQTGNSNALVTQEIGGPGLSWVPASYAMVLEAEVSTGSVTSWTFSLRAGPSSSTTIYFNGDGTNQIYGGALLSFIEVYEVEQ